MSALVKKNTSPTEPCLALKPQEWQNIIDTLSARVRKDRDALTDYVMLGQALRAMDQAKRAYKLLYNLLVHPRLDKKTKAKLLTELGWTSLDLARHEEAVTFFNQSLKLQSKSELGLLGLARSYKLLGHHDLALKAWEQLAKNHPNHKPLWAQALVEQGQRKLIANAWQEALTLIQKGVRLEPGCLSHQLALIEALSKNQRLDDALGTLKKVAQHWPQCPQVIRWLDELHYQKGAYSEVEHTLRDWLTVIADNSFLHLALAKYYIRKHSYAQAITQLCIALEIDCQNTEALQALILLYLRQQNTSPIDNLEAVTRRFFEALLSTQSNTSSPDCC